MPVLVHSTRSSWQWQFFAVLQYCVRWREKNRTKKHRYKKQTKDYNNRLFNNIRHIIQKCALKTTGWMTVSWEEFMAWKFNGLKWDHYIPYYYPCDKGFLLHTACWSQTRVVQGTALIEAQWCTPQNIVKWCCTPGPGTCLQPGLKSKEGKF